MTTAISVIEIHNEIDLVLTHRRAMQICKFAGIGLAEQTRFATAVSEICRNCLMYGNSGKITYNLVKMGDEYKLEVIVKDEGKGIKDLDAILLRDPQVYKGRGLGIVFARKLSDGFKIKSTSGGTTVILEKYIASNAVPINSLIIKGWILHLKNEPVVSAYEELKNRNVQLIQLTEELKTEKLKVDQQIDQIKELNAILETRNAYLQQFTYSVSHELKTPLTSLKLSITLLQENKNHILQQELIDVIARAEKKLDKTVTGIVNILELQSKGKQAAKTVLFEEELLDVIDPIKKHYGIDAIHLITDFNAVKEICYVQAYISSIFSNLLSNAVKYRSDERPLAIAVATSRRDNYIILTFMDNGEGINLISNGDTLFSPFTRFNTSKEGNGIGLYIVKNMVEKNGGKIQVESLPDKGTTFHFFLKEYELEQV
ncbi:sensor histidine kinase [Ferruginibacter paludis]|uniref:sensor histidine kinase n=1 Tax=Ferruginibacter paludis TaxID=1310417 RepID=UPI0025B4E4C8|nr:sensor histidine kinase [Ferruginibacter paludis]MDN3657243.1 sensor histidine kinase [Ferruginibacter paludis]